MNTALYSVENGVGIVSLNRPEALNAINIDLIEELTIVTDRILEDDSVRAIVLTGNGRAFCSGGDQKDQSFRKDDAVVRRNFLKKLNGLVSKLYKSPKPIVSAVNGYAVGAGMGLALVGDLIIGSPDTKFFAPFVKLGLMADGGVSYLASRRIGTERTKRILLTGETIKAEVAEQWGLLDWVVQTEELLPMALKVAQQLADSPQTAVEMTKTLLNHMGDLPFDAALEQEQSNQVICMVSKEHKEAKAIADSKRK